MGYAAQALLFCSSCKKGYPFSFEYSKLLGQTGLMRLAMTPEEYFERGWLIVDDPVACRQKLAFVALASRTTGMSKESSRLLSKKTCVSRTLAGTRPTRRQPPRSTPSAKVTWRNTVHHHRRQARVHRHRHLRRRRLGTQAHRARATQDGRRQHKLAYQPTSKTYRPRRPGLHALGWKAHQGSQHLLIRLTFLPVEDPSARF